MAKRIIYPTEYELEEVMSEIVDSNFLKGFSNARGIFMLNASQKDLAKELSYLYYEDKDLESIREKAYHKINNHTLSGFVIESTDENFSLVDLYSSIRKEAKFPKGYVLNSLTKAKDKEIYKGNIEYIKTKAARIQFLQDEIGSFNFYFINKDGKWQVEVDCSKSTDSKELFSILEKNLRKDLEDTQVLDENYLSTEQSILFFDELRTKGLPNEWNLVDIKSITLRKGKDDDDNSEDSEEISDEHLAGIRQAILEGKNLRNNRFVIESEKSGYRFTSMIYEFSNSKTPNYIKIKAEFKGRPKVFEVGIISYEGVYGSTLDALVRQPEDLKEIENFQIRSIFWNNAKIIFDSLYT